MKPRNGLHSEDGSSNPLNGQEEKGLVVCFFPLNPSATVCPIRRTDLDGCSAYVHDRSSLELPRKARERSRSIHQNLLLVPRSLIHHESCLV